MSSSETRDHLAEAERHVAQAERRLDRQRAFCGKLEREGHDTQYARALLHHLEEVQALHVAGRDRIRAELQEASGPQGA